MIRLYEIILFKGKLIVCIIRHIIIVIKGVFPQIIISLSSDYLINISFMAMSSTGNNGYECYTLNSWMLKYHDNLRLHI